MSDLGIEISTSTKEAERKLRLYETVLNNTPDFVYVFSLDHKVIYANDSLISMWGRGREGAIGKTFLEIGYEPWHAEMHNREIDQVRTTRQPIRGEVAFTGTLGRRQYEYIFVPVFNANGDVEAVAGTTRDVTERFRSDAALRESEERAAFVRRSSGVGFFYCDLPFDVLQWDELVKAHFHLPPDATVTIETFFQRIHPDDREPTRTAIDHSIKHRAPYNVEYRTVHPETGKVHWLRAIGRTFYADDGTPTRFDGVTLDITAQKLAERRQEYLIRLADTLRPLTDPVELQAEASRVLGEYFNANRVVYFEIRGDEYIIEKDYTSGVSPLAGRYSIADFGDSILRRLLAGQTIVESDATTDPIRPPSEQAAFRAIQVRGHVDVPLVKEGKFVAGMAVHLSCTKDWAPEDVMLIEETAERTWAALERSRAEKALQESEARYRAVVEDQSEMVCRFHADGTILFVNTSYARAVGRTREEVQRTNFWTLIPPEDRQPVQEMLDRLTPDAPEARSVNRFMTKEGERWTLWTNRGLKFDASGRVTEAQSAGIDITERKNAEAALRESEERFRSFTDTAPAMLWATDTDGMCTFLSKSWYLFTGQSEKDALGLGWTSAIHPDDRERAGRLFLDASRARLPHFAVEYRVRCADGRYRWAIDIGRPRYSSDGVFLGYVGNVIDIDEQKRTADELARHRAHLQQMVDERTAELELSHRQLRMSERMAALGTLSAGLGHDMGNLLLPLRVHVESLLRAELPQSLREDVQAIQISAEYLRRLSAGLRLLALNPDRASANDATDLRSWWDEAEPMLRNVVPRRVTVLGRIPDDECWVAISRPAITQAVFNLVQNAGDAMRNGTAGTVTVFAERRNSSVILRVTDNGPGMPPDVKARCMEPFFTTKPRDISTGLGLALVYSLVQRAGGSVDIDTKPGLGTTFSLTLPAARIPSAAQDRPAAVNRCAFISLKDLRLLAFVTAELRSLGFDIQQERGASTDLIVTDDPALAGDQLPTRPIILLGLTDPGDKENLITLGPRPPLQSIRETLRNVSLRTQMPRT